ncbi:MAG: hypothetical protein KBC27_03755 [Rickettsiales bacterium]|nr:hypothetical protein [Rickettsiales bacterium]
MENLVLLPGYGFKSSIWDNFIKQLSGSYNIITIDILKDQDEILDNLVKVPNKSYLCGWSLGGLIATKFCTLFPEKQHYLVTIASSPNFQKVLNQAWVVKLRDVLKQDFCKFINILTCSVLYPNVSIRNVRVLNKYLIKDAAYFEKYLDFLLNTNVEDGYRVLNSKSFHLIAERDAIVSHETLKQWQSNEFADTDSYVFRGHYPFFYNQILSIIIEKWILKNKI